MNKHEIREKIMQFIADRFMVARKVRKLEDHDSFMDKGVIDSAGVLELVSYVEKEFGVSFLDTELVPENLDSLANIVNYVAMKRVSVGEPALAQ